MIILIKSFLFVIALVLSALAFLVFLGGELGRNQDRGPVKLLGWACALAWLVFLSVAIFA